MSRSIRRRTVWAGSKHVRCGIDIDRWYIAKGLLEQGTSLSKTSQPGAFPEAPTPGPVEASGAGALHLQPCIQSHLSNVHHIKPMARYRTIQSILPIQPSHAPYTSPNPGTATTLAACIAPRHPKIRLARPTLAQHKRALLLLLPIPPHHLPPPPSSPPPLPSTPRPPSPAAPAAPPAAAPPVPPPACAGSSPARGATGCAVRAGGWTCGRRGRWRRGRGDWIKASWSEGGRRRGWVRVGGVEEVGDGGGVHEVGVGGQVVDGGDGVCGAGGVGGNAAEGDRLGESLGGGLRVGSRAWEEGGEGRGGVVEVKGRISERRRT